jgi:hypothetical protein
MADIRVTVQAVCRLLRVLVVDERCQRAVAMQAVLLGYITVHRGDANRLREVVSREGDTVFHPVDSLDQVLFDNGGVRHVAIITRGNGFMAANTPRGVHVAHDVAVGAGLSIVGEIGSSLSMKKGKAAQAKEAAQKANDKQPGWEWYCLQSCAKGRCSHVNLVCKASRHSDTCEPGLDSDGGPFVVGIRQVALMTAPQ